MTRTRRIVRNIANGLLILAFFAALWTAWVARFLGWGNAPCPNENRVLAALPDFHLTSLAELPKKLEAYVQDHLPYRAEFIKQHAYFKHAYLGLRSDSILIGKDGFLFYDQDCRQSSDYTGQAPLRAEQLAQWKLYPGRRRDFLAARHCRYLFVIAPIRPPSTERSCRTTWRTTRAHTRREQLLAYLATTGAVDVPRPGPAAARGQTQRPDLLPRRLRMVRLRLSSGHGHHRPATTRLVPGDPLRCAGGKLRVEDPAGAHGAVVDVRDPAAGRAAGGGFSCPPRAAGMQADRGRAAGQLAEAGLRPFAEIWATDQPGPGHRLLVLGDSYMGTGVSPMQERPLGDCFRHALFHGNASPGRIPHDQFESLVYQERPDVVIEEMAERNLRFEPYAGAMAPAEPALDRTDLAAGTEADPSPLAGLVKKSF